MIENLPGDQKVGVGLQENSEVSSLAVRRRSRAKRVEVQLTMAVPPPTPIHPTWNDWALWLSE